MNLTLKGNADLDPKIHFIGRTREELIEVPPPPVKKKNVKTCRIHLPTSLLTGVEVEGRWEKIIANYENPSGSFLAHFDCSSFALVVKITLFFKLKLIKSKPECHHLRSNLFVPLTSG
jgi:hypothetical protein